MSKLIDPAKTFIKKLTAKIQKPSDSYDRHNAEYLDPGVIEQERAKVPLYQTREAFNDQENKLGLLLKKYPQVRALAIDIGSGVGWLSALLSTDFGSVVAIEPSSAAVEIARRLYPAANFPNIDWRVGFAESVIPGLSFTQPTLFVTGCVLSHLRDAETAKICAAVNAGAPKGSILGFNECWGTEWHQKLWHVRTKEWWQAQLPGFQIDFHGPEIENVPGRHKGFHAIKIS